MIHENYRRFLRSGRRRCLVRLTVHVSCYKLMRGDVVRLAEVDQVGRAYFEPQGRKDHRRGMLMAHEWGWRKPEFVPAGRAS